jgi:hypothetical protein
MKYTTPLVVAITLAFTVIFSLPTFSVAQEEETPVQTPLIEVKDRPLLDIVTELATIKAADILAEQIIDKVILAAISEIKDSTDAKFRWGYRSARGVILDDIHYDKHYEHVRALVVTKVKNHLHQDGSLAKCYQDHRLKAIETFKGLKPEEKSRLALKLLAAQQTFTKIKDPASTKLFTELDNVRKKYNNELMRKNLSDEEMAEAILDGELVTYRDFDEYRSGALSIFEDQDLAEFAWRRWCEGGETLVNQYLEVINMVSEDLLLAK